MAHRRETVGETQQGKSVYLRDYEGHVHKGWSVTEGRYCWDVESEFSEWQEEWQKFHSLDAVA